MPIRGPACSFDTHRLPVTRLRRIFAGLLYLLGLRMLIGLLPA